ncbi:hypothetical protein SK128_000649 [Halocaridina rubra]|uniref:Uncharacterized protein n=1 Tax=Halocaridina rubra TaxID=373956 RepID=A0AAN8XBW5_HALRR
METATVPSATAASVDGVSLPSFPSTSYWYDAHSSIGLAVYPPGTSYSGTSYSYKHDHCEPKSLVNDSGRHIVDAWVDGLHPGSSTKNNYESSYWSESHTQGGYASPCNLTGDNLEYEAMEVMAPDISCQQDVNPNEGSIYSVESVPSEEVDDRLTNTSVASSEEFYPQSNSSSDFIICSSANNNKKHTQDPVANADEAKKNLKRQKKEVKEKVKEEKRCGVCGDAARSMHFGGMACDSCKAFFRRSVQSGAYKNFQCPENEQCPISKQNRKVCQYCRFKKSQENGMEISWVMSETDRMTLWKNRLAKQRHVQEEKIREEVYGDLPRGLDPEEADKLKNLAGLQEATFSSIPYPEDCHGDRVESLANLFVCICKKLGLFFNKVEDFAEVCKADQALLLKNGIGMSIYLHGAYMYDYENEIWPSASIKESLKIPPVSMCTLKKFTVFPEAFDAIMKFYTKYGREMKDEIILALMCVIAFFQPDDPSFLYPGKIQDIQVRYLEHLRHYLLAKEGENGVKATFPKLLVGLADIREILEFHSKVDIKPTINHQQIATQSNLKSQMAALQDLFCKGAKGFFPEFSSVLTASEKQHSMWKRNEKASSRRHRQRSGALLRTDQLYHPHTNQIFGGDPRTDMVLTNPMDQIDRFMKKHKLSIAQVTELADTDQSSSAVRPKYFKRSSHDFDKCRITSSDDNSSLQVEHWPSGRLQHVSQNGSSNWGNHSSVIEKKRAVEILCDILKHISCSDDDEDDILLQSLKQNLPPHLLNNLAQNFSTV